MYVMVEEQDQWNDCEDTVTLHVLPNVVQVTE